MDGGVVLLCILLLAFIFILALVVTASLGKLWKGSNLKRMGFDHRGDHRNFLDASEDPYFAARMNSRFAPQVQALEWHPGWKNAHNIQSSPYNMLCLPSAAGGLMRDNTRIMAQSMQFPDVGSKRDFCWNEAWDEHDFAPRYAHVPHNAPLTPPKRTPMDITPIKDSPVEVIELDENEVERYSTDVTLSEAMWGFGVLMDRFINKTQLQHADLDYEGLYFLLRGVTAEQILLMVLCLEAMVFADVPKYTNRVWSLVLRYYVENTKWQHDERLSPVPTDQARRLTKEADKMILAWHQFERQCIPRLSKYFDVRARMRAIRQVDISLPRRSDFVDKNSDNLEERDEEVASPDRKLVQETEKVPDRKRGLDTEQKTSPSRSSKSTAPTPTKKMTPQKAGKKKARSPSTGADEPNTKRQRMKNDLTPDEYQYRSIDGELRVFTIQEKVVTDGFKDSMDSCTYLFTQMTKSCTLQKAAGWFVGDLGGGYRVRLQRADSNPNGIDLQFCPGARKRWQNNVTAMPTRP